MSKKRKTIGPFERKIALAFYFFWDRQRRKARKEEIKKWIDLGYIDAAEAKKMEKDYLKLTKNFLLPMYIIFGDEIDEELKAGGEIDPEFRKEFYKKLVEDRAKYFSESQKNSFKWILSNLDLASDPLYAEMIKEAYGLNEQQIRSLFRYNKALKDGNTSTGVRLKKIKKYTKEQRKARSSMVGVSESSQGYSKIFTDTMNRLIERYNWQGVRKKWLTADDPRVCEHCRAVSNMEIGYNELFPIFGGIIGPEESHARCRCALEIIFPEDEDATKTPAKHEII